MILTVEALRSLAEPADLQALDGIVMRAATRRQENTERLARDCMARTPKGDESRRSRRPAHDSMRVV